MVKLDCSNFRIITAIFWVSKCLGVFRYYRIRWVPIFRVLKYTDVSAASFSQVWAWSGAKYFNRVHWPWWHRYWEDNCHAALSKYCPSLHPCCCIILKVYRQFEPPHDKTNKMACVPSEDLGQPGHLPSLIKVFDVHMKKPWVLSYPLSAQWRLWSDWADAQADLSLRWMHSHFLGFVMMRLILMSLALFFILIAYYACFEFKIISFLLYPVLHL